MNPIKDHGYVVGEKGKVKIDSYDKPYHAFHNHPSGETFSPDDLIQLSQRNNQMSVTAVGNNGSLYCVSKTGNANSAGYKQFIYDQCRQKRFLGKYSYFTVSSKSFDKSKLSESEIDKLGNQLSSFCERCAKGGVFYGFNYRKKEYTDEQIAEYWELYHKAKPYSDEDWENWELDGGIDEDRLGASVAKDILTELGLLDEQSQT